MIRARATTPKYLRAVPPLPDVLRAVCQFDAEVSDDLAASEFEPSPRMQARIRDAILHRCRLIRQERLRELFAPLAATADEPFPGKG